MARPTNRRGFLSTTSLSAAGAVAGWNFLGQLPRVSAEDAALGAKLVALNPSVEPLVRLIEETPRERLLEEVASRIRKGTSYREVLAALLLAGVRNVQPRPAVGFKFHAVLVVNSCHLASLSGSDDDRWLPIFWALDYFKNAQADEASRGGWQMPPVNEALVPDSQHARELFADAMKRWDVEQADVATAGLVRTAGATEVFNLFAKYAPRDFRAIGHKAIFLANAWRTLQVIGWEFSEPVLRSLSAALMNHGDEPNPAENDLAPDRPWRENEKRIGQIPAGWLDGKSDPGVAREVLAAARGGSPQTAAETAADVLAKGVSPQDVWDGVFVGGGELLMQQPGIVSLHGLTTANAMNYLWRNVADESLRKQLLLQACSFNALFHEAAKGRGKLATTTIDAIEPASGSPPTLEEITADISGDRLRAASKVEAFLASGGSPDDFAAAVRRLIFLKGRDSHDYKFSSAVLEDYGHVGQQWRDKFLALSVFNLKGTGDPDNGLVDRTRAALEG